jgi:hypothetical protein
LTYDWNAAAGRLTFHFTGSAFSADVRFQTYGAGVPVLDASFSMPAAPATPGVLFTSLQFASDLVLAQADIAAAHTPLLPGATLLPSFFQARVPAVFSYPGGGTFTSWTQVDLVNGTLIQYDLEGPDVIVPHSIRYTLAGAPYAVDDWVLQVFHPVNVTTNCSVGGSDRSMFGVPGSSGSPQQRGPPCGVGAAGTVTRRLRFGTRVTSPPGQPLAPASSWLPSGSGSSASDSSQWVSPAASLAVFAVDNGMLPAASAAGVGAGSGAATDSLPPALAAALAAFNGSSSSGSSAAVAAGVPVVSPLTPVLPSQGWPSAPFTPLRARLAAMGGPSFHRQVFQSAMMRMDAVVVNLPYSRYAARVLPGLPVPSLLHTSE